MPNASAALLTERYVVVTPLIKSVTITACDVLVEANILERVSRVTLLLLAALTCSNLLNNLAILDANASNFSARVSNVYSLNQTSL